MPPDTPYDLPRVLVACNTTALRRELAELLYEMWVEPHWHLQLGGLAEYAAWCRPQVIVLAMRSPQENLSAYTALHARYGDSPAVAIGLLGVPQELLDREGALTGEAVVPVRILEERSHGRIEAEPTLEHEAQGGRRDVALAHASREQEVIGRHLPALLPRGEAGRSLDHPPVGQHECRGGSGQPSLADQLLQPPLESCTQGIGIG